MSSFLNTNLINPIFKIDKIFWYNLNFMLTYKVRNNGLFEIAHRLASRNSSLL